MLKAEVGEIEKNWDKWRRNRESDLKRARGLASNSPGLFPPLEHYCGYTEGVEHLIETLNMTRDAILVFGCAPIGILASLEECFGRRGDVAVTKVLDIGF